MNDIVARLYAADPTYKTGKKLASGRIVTPAARAAFVHLFKPQKPMAIASDPTPKFAVTLLFPAEADLTLLKEAARGAIVDKWGADDTKWPNRLDENGNRVSLLRSPFRDQGEKEFAGYVRGRKFITLTSKDRPGLLDARGMVIDDETMFYSGAWCWVTVNAYAYDQAGNKGVALGLGNVQKLADDEPLTGRAKAESEFAPVAVPAGETPKGAASIFD